MSMSSKVSKPIIIVSILCIAVFLVAGVYALASITRSGSFTLFTPAPSIQISTPSGQSDEVGQVTASSVVTKSFTITNDGNTHITVSAALTASGCSANLNTVSGGLDIGQSYTFIVTLSSFTASGSYSVTFTAT